MAFHNLFSDVLKFPQVPSSATVHIYRSFQLEEATSRTDLWYGTRWSGIPSSLRLSSNHFTTLLRGRFVTCTMLLIIAFCIICICKKSYEEFNFQHIHYNSFHWYYYCKKKTKNKKKKKQKQSHWGHKSLLTVGLLVLLYTLSRVATWTFLSLFWADHLCLKTWTGTPFSLLDFTSSTVTDSAAMISIGLLSGNEDVGAGSSGKAALIITRFGGGSRSNSRTMALSRQSSAARLLIWKIREIPLRSHKIKQPESNSVKYSPSSLNF